MTRFDLRVIARLFFLYCDIIGNVYVSYFRKTTPFHSYILLLGKQTTMLRIFLEMRPITYVGVTPF